ncbi:MAG TPA: dienelactone hydrolase family protein [candidate division Zixibacteria bacterium]|nr:dienelactone hydrolase family protein [candidate division Zixibacteria bacterium]
MTQKIVSMHAAYASRGEVVDGFLARPLTRKPTPALVLLHGYRGVDEAQRAVTRKFAAAGFVCLSPDLFHGRVSRDPVTSAYLKTSLDIERAVEKAVDAAAYLRSLPFVGERKIALSGFCMGGGLALFGLARSDRFAAGVIYYQSLFPDPTELKTIRAPLQCHYGTNDANTTQAEIDMFCAALKQYGKKYEIHMYEGASHGFLNSTGKKSEVDRTASEAAFAKTCRWLKRVLA